MGAEPWHYFVPCEERVEDALYELRKRVFWSRDFRSSEMNPISIEQAVANAAEEGTASILDISEISPTPQLGCACPLPDARLTSLYGTTKPTHELVASNMDFYEELDRGQGIYIVVYRHSEPHEYFFAGYSFD